MLTPSLHNLTINVLSATLRVVLSLRLVGKAIYINDKRSGVVSRWISAG
jgi:hypothetical protein